MKKANILIARSRDAYRIKVEGRATFECSAPLRNLVHNIAPEGVRHVAVDLSACTGMDSTFMGVLAMIALRVRNLGPLVEIIGCSESNRHLLDGLGLKQLFVHRSVEATTADGSGEWVEATPPETLRDKAETVLQAHETLIEAAPGNRDKFGAVVKMVRDDLAKMDGGAEPGK